MPVFKSTRLLDQLRDQICYLHYSLRTEEAYLYWVKKFIRFHSLKHPRAMGQAEIEAFFDFSGHPAQGVRSGELDRNS